MHDTGIMPGDLVIKLDKARMTIELRIENVFKSTIINNVQESTAMKNCAITKIRKFHQTISAVIETCMAIETDFSKMI